MPRPVRWNMIVDSTVSDSQTFYALETCYVTIEYSEPNLWDFATCLLNDTRVLPNCHSLILSLSIACGITRMFHEKLQSSSPGPPGCTAK